MIQTNAEWIAGNLFIRPHTMKDKGERIETHKHNFDHLTVVFKGSVHIKAKLPQGQEIESDFSAPGHPNGYSSHAVIKAGVEHEITALEPDTVFWCIYAHNTPQGTISQVYDGWHQAYI